jgi:hypothetical protein
MKNLLLYFILIASVFFTSCQKELYFDTIPSNGQAVGTLKSLSGICLPSMVSGIYTRDSVLKAGNFIDVSADITATGTYAIKSDTIAGFYFTGTGTVTATGIQTIKLTGAGTPNAAGIKTFTIRFGTSFCMIDIQVAAGTPPPSAYTFTCAGTSFGTGIYTVGTAVGAQHTVTLNVAVTVPGPYTINIAAVNGISFSGSGTFTSTGNTTVILTASGTPVAASPPVYNYTVTNGASGCTFPITVTTVTPPPNLDYIPQTSFSNWSSRLAGGTPADTTFIQVSANSKTFGTNSYKIFEVKVLGVPTDSVYNRKNGGLYYQFIDGNLGILDNPINKEYLVLDSNRAVNYTWTANFGANVAMGFPLTNIRVEGLILGKGETQTVATNTYNNVIRVKYTYIATVLGLGDLTVAEEERWFALGIGVIRSSIMNLINPATIVNETTRAQVF